MSVTSIFIGTLFVVLRQITTNDVILFDSSKFHSLNWTTWTNYDHQDIPGGWLEESVPILERLTNARSYVACDIYKSNVDNWVQLPLILKGPANRLYIELRFTIRDCIEAEHLVKSCRETFSLLYREANTSLDITGFSIESTSFDERTKLFKFIDTITAPSGRFTGRHDIRISQETRNLEVFSKGLFFAFRDQGACVSIINIKVYYKVCNESWSNFAYFPTTPTGLHLTSLVRVTGRCSSNAKPYTTTAGNTYGALFPASTFDTSHLPIRVCLADGRWDLMTGGCQCDVGYTADETTQRCVACSDGYFKDVPGLGLCLPCPANSHTFQTASAFCNCDRGYFRINGASLSSPCFPPPSKPQHLKVVLVGASHAEIQWSQPSNSNESGRIWYRVDCVGCSSNTIFDPPKISRLNSTRLKMKNLLPGSEYSIHVYALSSLQTDYYFLLDDSRRANLTFCTRSLSESNSKLFKEQSYVVSNHYNVADEYLAPPSLLVDSSTNNEIVLTWHDKITLYDDADAEANDDDDDDDGQDTTNGRYELEAWLGKGYSWARIEVYNQTKFTYNGLDRMKQYEFRIRKYLDNNTWSRWSPIVIGRTKNYSTDYRNFLSDWRNVMVVAACLFGLVLIVLISSLCYHFRNDLFYKKHFWDCKIFRNIIRSTFRLKNNRKFSEYSGFKSSLNASNVAPPSFFLHNRECFSEKPYINPNLYKDPEVLLHEFTREIDPKLIRFEDSIGSGQFGDVYKAVIDFDDYGISKLVHQNFTTILPANVSSSRLVAIKTLKRGASVKDRANFLIEASIMGQFDHQNVVRLIGVVLKTEPVMIITEFVPNGSLDSFLKNKQDMIASCQLTQMLLDVAKGLKYLTDRNYIHRDVAARNVLVDDCLSCKISDFGFSRFIESPESTYTSQHGLIPVRWTAPEAVTERLFTTASDVWSFGVCAWETFSYGKRPYSNMSNTEVMENVRNGYRLPKPVNCPNILYSLMIECWNAKRELRPSFSKICSVLFDYRCSFHDCPTSPHYVPYDLKAPRLSTSINQTQSLQYCTINSRIHVERPCSGQLQYRPYQNAQIYYPA